ncbi:hypothetical protein [Streptomyces sp. Y1]|uniref:YncE family protein n=1 Tax=Streptomyces sp. Y1 TaxID=3238634 RepID=A0AB39TFL0_9ACTN
MSKRTRAKAARWTAATAAATVLALTGTAAQAAAATRATPVSGTEAVIAVGNNRAQPMVGPDGTKAYVVVDGPASTVLVKAVDTRSDAVTGQVSVGTNQVFVSAALSPDGTRLYVANGQQFSVLDTASLTVLATVALPDQPRQTGWTPGAPSGVTVSPDGTSVYVVQNGPTAYRQNAPARVLAFSAGQRAFTGSVQLTAPMTGTAAIRPNGQDLYVGTSTGVQHVKAAAAPTLAGTVPGTATALDYNPVLTPDGTRLFAVGQQGQADLIDPATDTVVKHLALTPTNTSLSSPQISADGTRLYVAENDFTAGPSVLAFDTATGNAVPDETVSPDEDVLNGLAAGPDGHTLYVTGSIGTSGKLQVIAN